VDCKGLSWLGKHNVTCARRGFQSDRFTMPRAKFKNRATGRGLPSHY
jgi:hypothetical protein